MEEYENAPRVRFITLIAISVLAFGTVFYRFVEGWSWLDSLWFCVITLTTVGYGDIVPVTVGGRIFTMIYIVIGIGIFAASINYVIRRSAINRLKKHQKEHAHKEKKKQ